MSTLSVVFKLGGLRCYKSGENPAAEPYLWTLFFEVDGETLFFSLEIGRFQTTRMVRDETGDGFEVDPDHHGHKPPPGSHHLGSPHPVTGDSEATFLDTGTEGDLCPASEPATLSRLLAPLANGHDREADPYPAAIGDRTHERHHRLYCCAHGRRHCP